MALTNKLKKLLHRKAWETCTSCPVASAAGVFIANDRFDQLAGVGAILVAGVSSIYLYLGSEDAWLQLPNSGATGTFGAGACGTLRALGAMGGVFNQTATAGTTTTVTTNRTIVKSLKDSRFRVVAGTGAGYDGVVLSNTLGANSIITLSTPNGVAFDATTQFQVYSGSLWFMNSGAGTVGFSVYDIATNAWTARSVTGLPTTWGTDAKLVSTMGAISSVAIGDVSSASSTTLSNALKAWNTNMWANYQVRITQGTGAGQIRSIASNTGTALTLSSAWTVTPDVTSKYSIEGNDDYLYLLGNNAVTMYRYSVSGNSWSTLAPVAARAGAAGAGLSANWIESCTGWDNETQVPHYTSTVFKQNGRYIYSFRGAAGNVLDIYDIAANTWISGVAYAGQQETFTTGTSFVDVEGLIYANKEATGRVLRFDVDKNKLEPLATNTNQVALGGAATVGDKIFILPYKEGATTVNFLYAIRHSATDLVRMLLI